MLQRLPSPRPASLVLHYHLAGFLLEKIHEQAYTRPLGG